jgi:hypothetical protein
VQKSLCVLRQVAPGRVLKARGGSIGGAGVLEFKVVFHELNSVGKRLLALQRANRSVWSCGVKAVATFGTKREKESERRAMPYGKGSCRTKSVRIGGVKRGTEEVGAKEEGKKAETV